MRKEIKNVEASIKAKLLNYAKKENISFNRLLLYYFQERFLYRLSISKYKNKFILKGGSLLLTLSVGKGRPTQDIDFLVRLDNLDNIKAEKILREIISISTLDGVIFHPDSIKFKNFKENWNVNAIRVSFNATLGSTKSNMQIDIGFKDSVVPDPVFLQYPTILDLPAPKIRGYSWETVIAEKFEAMIKLHTLNSRLKDFYDIHYLASMQTFDSQSLLNAISTTFKKRGLTIEAEPFIFSEKFIGDKEKQIQWKAFLKKTKVKSYDDFSKVILSIKDFLLPITKKIVENKSFSKKWDPQKRIWH